jgi:HK97 family phage major capsid protein
VFDNLPKYGVAFTYADVRQTDRTSVRVISLDSGLTFYATNEAGVKTSAKLSFSKNEVSLQKYAVIVPAADEFTDDAAVDYWNLVTKELSRAYAKKADEVTFTDSSSGITNQTGVLTHTLGAGLNWDDLLVAQSKTEDDLDESGAKWYMRKETWYSLIQTKGTTNDHYIAGSLNTATGWVANPNQPTTPWGTPVVFTRVLPTINSVSANDAVAVYGDLSNYLLYNKRGMALKILTEATVVDSEGTDLHLGSQDASAMRAVVRMLGILPKGNRGKFVVLGTGTVS